MLTILKGDALSQLKTLDDESAQCCVTSPPYFGLRSYGTPPLIWDGADDCGHEFVTLPDKRNRYGETITLSDKQWTNRGTAWPIIPSGSSCKKCNAWCGELGLEPFVELYVAHLVQIFAEVRRVLRKSGTLWLVIGDSFAGSGNGWQKSDCSIPRPWLDANRPGDEQGRPPGYISSKQKNGLKPKDLIGVPWMVAFALRSDGWYLRSDVIWAKKNCMPESVKDRPTRSHEYVFLFAKSERYYYDADAIAEPIAESSIERIPQSTFDSQTGGEKDYGDESNRSCRNALENLHEKVMRPGVNSRMFQDCDPNHPSERKMKRTDTKEMRPSAPTRAERKAVKFGGNKADGYGTTRHSGKEWTPNMGASGVRRDGLNMAHERNLSAIMRNKRDVWTIATAPFPEAHFAVYPTELAIPCVLAGSKTGDTVLDPFAGSGTTGKVAIELGRKAIMIEPKAEYVEMIERRCKTTIGLPFGTGA